MLNNLSASKTDPILQLIDLFKNDPRDNKIDLGVGVFKDENGQTPVMQAVKEAQKRLIKSQSSMAYVGMAGNVDFNNAMARLIFGKDADFNRIRGIQAPGGCGALKILSEMLFKASDKKRIWVSDPTWGNHFPIFANTGFEIDTYPYLDIHSRRVNEDALLDKMASFNQDDIVLLHGVCHNPSGAELSLEAWVEIARLASKNGFFPFIDLAYQGFGNSLEEDTAGVRIMLENAAQMALAASCSKNFGLYRERVGAAFIIAENSEQADIARDHTYIAARTAYSMPPDHGASCVDIILHDDELRNLWQQELDENRNRILSLRNKLSAALRAHSGSNDWDFIAQHRGMFSLLVIDEEQRQKLINDYAIYCVNGGRINIAGLRDDAQIDTFARALVEVTS